MIVEKDRKKESKFYPRIRCTEEVYNRIAEIADECDLTLNAVISSLLEYALAHSRVETKQKVIEESTLIIGEEY